TDAVKNVVASDREGDEGNLMRLQELHRFRELISERIRAYSAGNHRRRGLARTTELGEAKFRMPRSIVSVQVVDVTLVRLDEHARLTRLNAARQRIAECEIVNRRRSRICGCRDPQCQD